MSDRPGASRNFIVGRNPSEDLLATPRATACVFGAIFRAISNVQGWFLGRDLWAWVGTALKCYVGRLLFAVQELLNGSTPDSLSVEPPYVSSSLRAVDKTVLVQSHMSRFASRFATRQWPKNYFNCTKFGVTFLAVFLATNVQYSQIETVQFTAN